MTAQTGPPEHFDAPLDEIEELDDEPVLYVVDERPDGPAELLRLAPDEPDTPDSTEDPNDPRTDETDGAVQALPE